MYESSTGNTQTLNEVFSSLVDHTIMRSNYGIISLDIIPPKLLYCPRRRKIRRMQENMKEPRKGGKKRKIILTCVIVFAILVTAALLAFLFLWDKYRKIDKIELKETKVNELPEQTEVVMKGYKTYAVFGLDNRSNGDFKSGNSDTIIVVSINQDTGEIKMASIYRDTYLDIKDGRFRKANAAYSAGGPQQAVNMLNKNLDLNITEYVAVDFNAVVDAVDMLGGVELDIAKNEVGYMNDYIDGVSEVTGKPAHHVTAGTQLCDGVQATGYARIRYTTGWDYKRTERQRTVVTKMFEKAKQSDVFTLNNMVDKIVEEVSTNIELSEMLERIGEIGSYYMGENTGFPFEKESADVGKQGDMVIPVDLENNVVELHKFLYANEEYTPSDTVKKLSQTIHNNTGY